MAAVLEKLQVASPPVIDEQLLRAPEIDHSTGFAIIPEVAKVAHAKAHFTVKIPDRVTDPFAAFIAHGYGGIGTGYENLGSAIAASGKVAVEMDPVYSFSWYNNLNPKLAFKPITLPSMANWATMKKVYEMFGHEIAGFDVVGHSFGGITGSTTSRHKPDHVRSMTFVGSASQYPQSLASLAIGAGKFVFLEGPGLVHSEHPHNPRRAAVQIVRYAFNPHRRILEAATIPQADMRKRAMQLRDKGVVTAVVDFAKDAFFDRNKIRRNMGSIVDIYEPHPDPNAGHGAPQKDPVGVANTLSTVWAQVNELSNR